ncbi:MULTISPECIES: GlsB/YeaQ/YmgE family stress response membrane protein [unclassified Mesorhizobium]|uniref:GlsB/YeaQ/YmgE family stress response membrane protein n=1 Tax=unclassified Mesorhizobium TaxID=325217 RepID=UPI0003D04ADB|nr:MULTISPECIES: GlsB/YeaQ/YmgE family stress response membrane protein [unclassified Mesorhizobium]ESZ37397.1 membrane protein [Mesorhizobium sp. L2C067A000]ESZ61848.1 membrane protein [Mesorhizobium sp. L103C131B0]
MGIESLLIFIIIGAIAGWLAGLIVSGFGFGLIGNIIVGVIGALIAGWLFPRLGFAIGGGILAAIINATIGAVILLVLVKVLKRA